MKPQLTLFVREYCHLCQQMLGQLQAYQAKFLLNVVDIEDDDATEERYGQLIPVLMAGDEEICHYHLNTQRLDAYLAKFS
ncbi:glutaredoxin family protein [Leeia oryzae]|uniref:glutaredoxin family protein n=1 Tax=Leeia oryzae TaxID=356662 RepID=UPI00038114F2|nr:glutaredoxin family protein [Leeia oryzae]